MTAAVPGQQELEERIAILRRFRKLIEEQRNKFREYLLVLEKQQGTIETDNTEALIAHTELEQQIVAHIGSLQRVIVPMQRLYQAVSIGPGFAADDTDQITKIQAELSTLQNSVLEQNEKNRKLLQTHIDQIKTQMYSVRAANPYRGKQSVYAEPSVRGNIIQIDI